MRRIPTLLRTSILWMSSASGYVCTFCVVVILFLILTDVTLRGTIGKSILVAEELGGYLIVAITFLGLSYTLRMGRHVRVQMITQRLSLRVRYILHLITTMLSIGVIGVGVWQTYVLTWNSYQDEVISLGILHTPQYIPQLVMIVGMFLFGLQAIAELLKTRGEFWKEEGGGELDVAL